MNKIKNLYAVILAGGKGQRLWPLSRKALPKHAIAIRGTQTLLDSTIKRMAHFIPRKRIYIVTNRAYLRNIRYRNVIAEPSSRNTAAAIALAASVIREKDPRAVMVAAPSDQWIGGTGGFAKTIASAARFAAGNDVLVTLGIKPAAPATGYGYIKAKSEKRKTKNDIILRVEKFIEKPSLERAKQFYRDKNYFWNAGIFVWSIPAFYRALGRYLPRLKNLNLKNARRLYPRLPDISVDYGLMEKARNAYCIPAPFAWDDIGNFNRLAQFRGGSRPRIISLDSKRCKIFTDRDHLVATLGVSDLVIACTKDATLVCHAQDAERVRHLIAVLGKDKALKKYL